MKTINSKLSVSLPLIALAIIISLAGCEQKKEQAENPDQGGGTPRSIDKPKQTITLERAHQMYKSYQPRYDALTEFRNGKEDAQYGWHSLDFYKNYIGYLEQEAKKVKMKVSGLRLYYAAYPEDEMSGKKAGYQTYLFVPTYFDKKQNKHIAFDPLNMDENGKPIPIHQIIVNGQVYKDANTDKQGGVVANAMQQVSLTKSSIANMGEMCPFNCPESSER